MNQAKKEPLELMKELYEIKNQVYNKKVLQLKRPNKLLQLKKLEAIKEKAIQEDEKFIIEECEILEKHISYPKYKGKNSEEISAIEFKNESLDKKLGEILNFLGYRINNEEKLSRLNSCEPELKDLKSYYKSIKEKEKVKLIKKALPKIKECRKYYKFLGEANNDLENILKRCFNMNRKTDFRVRDSMLYYFRMKKLGGYSKTIKNDLLKYSDQASNEDLAEKIGLKNSSLENLEEKIQTKICNIKMLLDENLEHIASYLADRNMTYPDGFLRKQKRRLFFLTLKYNALGLDYAAEKSRILAKEMEIRLDSIKSDKLKVKKIAYTPKTKDYRQLYS